MEAATHWGEDSRFAQCETDVSYRHYAEPEHRFISQVQERYIRRDLASVLVWPAAAACAGGSHLLIPGLNFALDYLEVLEASELRDALLLGTVLEVSPPPFLVSLRRPYAGAKGLDGHGGATLGGALQARAPPAARGHRRPL